MDEAKVDRIDLFSKYPGPAGGEYRREDARASIDHIAKVQAADPDRIFGLIWAEPRTPGMVEEIEYGIVDRGLRGVKMIPDHWAPTDELLFPIYEKMQALKKPIMFHSGILYGFGDSSRFCRPVLYEALVNFPGLRFSLAHISWPWVDECIAVFGRFSAAAGYNGDRCQMWIDTCRGTPDGWREEALRKAVPFCGTGRLMFGVDCNPASLPANAPQHVAKDVMILRDIMGLSEEQIQMFFWGACEAFYAG
jgi:predicted TIM-barrel fold metal-dependent hydrolase